MAVRHRREVGACSGIPDRKLYGLSLELARRYGQPAAAFPPEHHEPFARPDENLGLVRAPGDRREYPNVVVRADHAVERHTFAVHKDIDVTAEGPFFVEDPAGQGGAIALQLRQDAAETRARDLVLGEPAGSLLEGCGKTHPCHTGNLTAGGIAPL